MGRLIDCPVCTHMMVNHDPAPGCNVPGCGCTRSRGTVTPRDIDPKDIRVGDRVRVEWIEGDMEVAKTFTVAEIKAGIARTRIGAGFTLESSDTWTLLDRPEPPRKVGSRWRDPKTGACYVKTDHPEYLRYRAGHVGADSRLDENCTDDRVTIARLVPVDGE